MNKIYKLLIDSPEYPKGTIATQISPNVYTLSIKDINFLTELFAINIENRPEVWEVQTEKLDIRSSEAEKMREESRATRFDFIPRRGDRCFYYDFEREKAQAMWYGLLYVNDWYNGFIKRSEKECQTHSEKYARYFLTE